MLIFRKRPAIPLAKWAIHPDLERDQKALSLGRESGCEVREKLKNVILESKSE